MIGRCVANRPLSNYNFDGNVNDTGIGGYNGTAINSPSYTSNEFGQANQAISLNGSNQRVDFSSNLGYVIRDAYNSGGFTIYYRMKYNGGAVFGMLLTSANLYNEDRYFLHTHDGRVGNNSYNFLIYNSSGYLNNNSLSDVNITNSVWKTIIYKGNNSLQYQTRDCNIEQSTSNTGDMQLTNKTTYTMLGARFNAAPQDYINAEFSLMRIYNVTLSDGTLKILNNEKGRIRA